MAQPRIIISGYYGCGNAGDEAILAGVLAGLRRTLPDARPLVATAAPADFEHGDIADAFRRYGLRRWSQALKEGDLLLLGGGSLIQDATSFRSLAYYLTVMAAAQRYKLKTMIYAQGVGPLRRGISRALAGRVLRRADRVVVRDGVSYKMLLDMGIEESKLVLAADQVLLLDPPERATEDTLAVVVRDWHGLERVLDPLAKALDASPLPVVFIPFQPGDSTAIARLRGRMTRGSRIAPYGGWRDTWEWVARSRAVLAMRLHGLIFAAAAGVPCVGLSYDPKVAAFAQEAEVEAWVDLDGLTEEQVSRGIAKAAAAPLGIRESVRRLAERAWLAPQAAAKVLAAAPSIVEQVSPIGESK